MIAPLAAIPVFAIVGVPQFAPVSASPSDDEEIADLGTSTTAPMSTPVATTQTPRASADDLFTRVPESRPAGGTLPGPDAKTGNSPATTGRQQPGGRWLPPPDSLDQWEIRPGPTGTEPPGGTKNPAKGRSAELNARDQMRQPAQQADAELDVDDFNPDLLKPERSKRGTQTREAPAKQPAGDRSGIGAGQFAPDLQGMSEQSGWQEAARRLKQLGIRKYRLTSQIDQQNFVFACTFTSPNNPQVVRRFEADADNPLEAVQNVLAQIDEWRGRTQSAPRPSEDE
jgi:hypothetical protein